MTSLYIDGDACPVRDEVYRVADRLHLPVFVVANGSRPIRPTGRPNVTMITVEAGADVADDWIADHITEADVCVTSDIPLASRCVAKGSRALAPNGKIWTPDNIGNALAGREIGRHLREIGLNTGGPAPLTKQDRSRFLSALDTLVQAAHRGQKRAERMTDKVLGVLGGMGPLASAHFMLRLTMLTPAERDQDHVPAVLWSDPRIPDRIAGQRGTGPDPLPWLLHGINGLRQAGCGAIVIPCNTVHAWYPQMAEASEIPILHIVDATVADLRRLGVAPGTIGVMGTVPTLASRLYQDRLEAEGWPCIQPDTAQMEQLVLPAIAMVKVNRLAEAFAPLAEAVNSLASRGATAVVLGCTEIPLGIQAGPPSALAIPVVDTVDSLAHAAIRWAKG